MEKYLIGIDGGGTRSRLLAYSTTGKVIGLQEGGSTNIESNTTQEVGKNLRELLESFFVNYSKNDCLALGFGTAGVDTRKTLHKVETLVKELNYPFPTYVYNDGQIALAAQTRGKEGLLLISGTGSIAFGNNEKGESGRVGGYGYLVSDEGSGYWLGQKAIAASLQSHDGTGEETLLLYEILDRLKIKEVDDLVDFVYTSNKKDIAKLSPLVEGLREKGDKVACGIMEEGAEKLKNMVIALSKKLNMKNIHLIFAGGVLLNTPWLREEIVRQLKKEHQNINAELLQREATMGGIYLAANKLGLEIPDFFK